MSKKRRINKERIFNLLKPQVSPPTAWDKVYDWLLGRARVIMVISEILVALAFLGKVLVDVDAKFLDDRILLQDLELRQYAKSIEPQLRTLQQKANVYTVLWNQSSRYESVLKALHQVVPTATSGLMIRMNRGTVTVSGGQNVALLSEIEAELKKSPLFSDVAIVSVASEGAEVDTDQANYILSAKVRDLTSRTNIGPEQNLPSPTNGLTN